MRYLGILAIVALLVTPAMGAFCGWGDAFTYPDGPLAGNDGWTGTGVGIDVVSNEVRIGLGGTAFMDTVNIPAETGTAAGQIHCRLSAKPGVSSGSNIWSVHYNDAAGNNYGRWYGSGNSARPRIDGFGQVLAPVTLTPGWNSLVIVIDQVAGMSNFYHCGTYLGQLAYAANQPGIGGGVSQVALENMGRTDVPNDYIMVDNAEVYPEPTTLALLLLGLPLLRRRR